MTELDQGTVFSRIAVVLVLVCAGFLARRLRLVDGPALTALSRLLIDLAFPALIIVNLLATVDPAALRAEWYVPAAAALLMPLSWWCAARVLAPTSAFLVGLPNWIFLPLLIAEALYGAAGVRVVLLFNAGAQLALWTIGIATLTGRADPGRLLRIPGLWATALGIVLALTVPALGAVARTPSAATGWMAVPAVILEGLALIGQMAIPLALCVTGGLLAERPILQTLRPSRALVVVLAGRLLIVPAITTALVLAADQLIPMRPAARTLIILTFAMPVAISSAVHARRFGGDATLAAQAVAWSTVLSLASVPLLVRLL